MQRAQYYNGKKSAPVNRVDHSSWRKVGSLRGVEVRQMEWGSERKTRKGFRQNLTIQMTYAKSHMESYYETLCFKSRYDRTLRANILIVKLHFVLIKNVQ